MKKALTLILYSLVAMSLSAQTNITQIKVGEEKVIEVITSEKSDTTRIRIGQRTFDIIDSQSGTHINTGREKRKKNSYGHFNPHWAGLEVGLNMFHNTDYSLYNGDEFFDLIPEKSLTWNLNFAEWAFKNNLNNFGLVTGLGFSFSDYTFSRPITIEKHNGNGMIIPVGIDPDGLKKSKLTAIYLTAPLMLEVRTPLRKKGTSLNFAGGVIGGVNISAHTKYIYGKDKEKYRNNYNLTPFKYELTGRVGFGEFCIFANYSLTPLFTKGKGPELYPLMIGISFPNI